MKGFWEKVIIFTEANQGWCETSQQKQWKPPWNCFKKIAANLKFYKSRKIPFKNKSEKNNFQANENQKNPLLATLAKNCTNENTNKTNQQKQTGFFGQKEEYPMIFYIPLKWRIIEKVNLWVI